MNWLYKIAQVIDPWKQTWEEFIANMLRLTTSSALRFQDLPSWAAHDIPNYIFGAAALYLSYLAGRWRFVERFSTQANR